jgi:hypothetical protein
VGHEAVVDEVAEADGAAEVSDEPPSDPQAVRPIPVARATARKALPRSRRGECFVVRCATAFSPDPDMVFSRWKGAKRGAREVEKLSPLPLGPHRNTKWR